MTDSLKIGKRAFTVAVAAATILWSIGISAFVAPMSARAASAGDVIKGTTLSTVYYYGSDGSRYAFPNEKSYFTWYSDFSDVETITDSELAAISLAGNVVYRPGSRWVKIQSDPKTYVVSTEGTVRWVESEEVAEGLAGSDWNTMIDDVPDTFFVDYTVGTSLTDAGDAFDGALVDMDGVTYLVWGDEMLMVSDAGFSANMFQTRNVLDGEGVDLAGLDAGDDLEDESSSLTDAAQLGEEVTGGLSVSLASDSPASATIPSGAASVAFTKVKLMASSGSADVSQMVFHLGSIGSVDNIDNAFLYEGSVRLTDARDVNSSTRNVSFTGLDISLDSGDSTYVTVRADITAAADSGDDASFALSDEDSVTSSATVSGSFPVSGNTMTFSSESAGTLTITAGNNPSDPTIGEEAAEIAEFDAETSTDAWLSEVTVNVDDAADHDNYELWHDGDLVASGSVNDDLVTFELTDSIWLEDGDVETFNVSADIGGEAADTITVTIEEEADVVAVGEDFGFNLGVDITDYDTAAEGSVTTIEGGELTFAFNGPSSDDIVVDGSDVVFMEFSITSANWTEIIEIPVSVEDAGEDNDANDDTGLLIDDAGGDFGALEDIAIREEDGSVWMGPEELDADGSDAAQTITFDDNMELQAGESLDLMLTADVSDDATAGEVYHMELDMDNVEAEDANGDTLAAGDVVPSADIIGNDMTVTTSSMTVTASTPPASGTYVKGASNVSVVGFSFEAGDAESVTVTDLLLTVDGDDDGTWSDELDIDESDFVSSCSLYDNESGALIDGPESLNDDDETLDFDNFDWTVDAGETAKIIVKCNFANQNSSDTADAYIFYIEDNGDITSEDSDGDSVVETLAEGNDTDDGEITIVTITTAGTMVVSASGSTPNSSIILGASTDVEISKVKFEASTESFIINAFQMQNTGSDDSVASSVTLTYTDSEGEEATDTGYLAAGFVKFDNLDLFVEADDDATVTISIDTNSVSSSGGADSGDTIELEFVDEEFEADGYNSNTSLDADDVADVAGFNVMTLRKTQPTLSLASGSPSGAGVAGDSEVFRFNVAADSRGDVTLDKVIFAVTTSDDDNDFNECDDGAGDTGLEDVTKWEIYDTDDSSSKLDDAGDWTFLDSGAGDAAQDCDVGEVIKYAVLDFEGSATTGPEEIGAGETKTYVVKVDTTGASSADDDAIRVDIIDEDEADTDTAFDATDDNDGFAIRWDDDNEGASITGALVDNLPVTGGTIQY